jgi:hypothetical protein
MPLSIAIQLRAGCGREVVSSPQDGGKNQVIAVPWTLVPAGCSGAQPTIYSAAGV